MQLIIQTQLELKWFNVLNIYTMSKKFEVTIKLKTKNYDQYCKSNQIMPNTIANTSNQIEFYTTQHNSDQYNCQTAAT